MCIGCSRTLPEPGTKQIVEWDGKMMCFKCYEFLPNRYRQGIAKIYDADANLKNKRLKARQQAEAAK